MSVLFWYICHTPHNKNNSKQLASKFLALTSNKCSLSLVLGSQNIHKAKALIHHFDNPPSPSGSSLPPDSLAHPLENQTVKLSRKTENHSFMFSKCIKTKQEQYTEEQLKKKFKTWFASYVVDTYQFGAMTCFAIWCLRFGFLC